MYNHNSVTLDLHFVLCDCDWQLTDDDVDAAGSSPASIKRVQSMPASKQAQMSRLVFVFLQFYQPLSNICITLLN